VKLRIAPETEKIKNDLAASRQGVQEFIRISNSDPEIGDGSSFILLKSAKELSERQRATLQSIAYSLAKAGELLIKKYPEILKESPRQLIDKIIRVSDRQGLALTEDAWQWIDREKDPELLKFILTLVLIDSHELRLSNIRRGLLENRRLCKALLEMTHDKEMLTGILKELGIKN